MEDVTQGWFRSSDSDSVIIFVHGLFSNNIDCWRNKEKDKYWPTLISEDERFVGIDIYLASFYTTKDATDYGVNNCSEEVLTQLKNQDDQLNNPPLDKKNIIFVTHSTGGIVVRYVIESNRTLFKNKKIALALYASPSFGSKMASGLGGMLAKIFNNKLAQELKWGSSILQDLDDRFKGLIDSGELSICGLEAYENKSPFHIPIINQSNKRVVEKMSASRYFGKPKLIPNSDHFSIVKPENTSEMSHTVLLELLTNKGFISRQPQVKLKGVGAESLLKIDEFNNHQPNVLFDFYHPCHESVYIIREEDINILNNIEVFGLWVCGQTGVGKTTSIQRAITKINAEIKYISLGVCVNETIEVMFNEIYSSFLGDDVGYKIYPLREVLKLIASKIRDSCINKKVVLLIEEIPITDQVMFVEFSQYIYALIIELARVDNFKLILSSIYEPAPFSGNEFDKILEKFKVVRTTAWEDKDMEKLVKIIEKTLCIKESKLDDISYFEGSPRNAKIYYRDFITKNKQGNQA
jgi:hypothetical protein